MARRKKSRAGGGALSAAAAPRLLLIPAIVAIAFLVFPLVGLVVRAPWSQAPRLLVNSEVLAALQLSVVTATLSTAICMVVGVPLAWLLARPGWPGRSVLRALVTVPLVLPPVVGGVALFTVFGRTGLLGRPLYDWTGFSLPFTSAAVVVAQSFVALPFLVLSVEGALRAADRRYEDAAATLGASPWRVFVRVTLPLVAPGIAAGAVLAWARALGEFGATITFAGNLTGTTQTMPLAVYEELETNPDAAVLLSVVLLAVSILVLGLLRERWVSQL
ncbi:ABC transporter permease [Fodinicola feengrottensis]|uniref:Molybdenum transport system permease n=1 Tax=Fodinicola feengrottensis TaxID=435914 RepID=A0ABN2GXF7_9ACTN